MFSQKENKLKFLFITFFKASSAPGALNPSGPPVTSLGSPSTGNPTTRTATRGVATRESGAPPSPLKTTHC